MKLLYTSANALVVNHLRNVVENAGITCRIRNEFLYSAAGELPPTETWPELWVGEEELPRAQRVVADALADKSHLSAWWCRQCGELVEGQFELCWNCGGQRPEGE